MNLKIPLLRRIPIIWLMTLIGYIWSRFEQSTAFVCIGFLLVLWFLYQGYQKTYYYTWERFTNRIKGGVVMTSLFLFYGIYLIAFAFPQYDSIIVIWLILLIWILIRSPYIVASVLSWRLWSKNDRSLLSKIKTWHPFHGSFITRYAWGSLWVQAKLLQLETESMQFPEELEAVIHQRVTLWVISPAVYLNEEDIHQYDHLLGAWAAWNDLFIESFEQTNQWFTLRIKTDYIILWT